MCNWSISNFLCFMISTSLCVSLFLVVGDVILFIKFEFLQHRSLIRHWFWRNYLLPNHNHLLRVRNESLKLLENLEAGRVVWHHHLQLVVWKIKGGLAYWAQLDSVYKRLLLLYNFFIAVLCNVCFRGNKIYLFVLCSTSNASFVLLWTWGSHQRKQKCAHIHLETMCSQCMCFITKIFFFPIVITNY
jgi:hypothetical protein